MTTNVQITNLGGHGRLVRVVRVNKDTKKEENQPVKLNYNQTVTIAVWDTTEIVIEEMS